MHCSVDSFKVVLRSAIFSTVTVKNSQTFVSQF